MENSISGLNESNYLLTKVKTEILSNPIICLIESEQIISTIKSKSEMFLKNAKFVLDNLSKSFEPIFNSKYSTNFFVEHNPGKRCTITS